MDGKRFLAKYHINDGIIPGAFCLITADEKETIIWCNENMADLYECSSQEAFLHYTGSTFRGMTSLQGPAFLRELVNRPDAELENNCIYVHFSFRSAKGHFREVDGYARHIEDESGAFWSLFLAGSNLRQLSLENDSMTKLMGRKLFYERALSVAVEDKENDVFGAHCPLYFNLANFKSYNLNHGFKAGDELLCRIADILRRNFPGDLIAHIGADSFVVLATSQDITKKVEKTCLEARKYINSPTIELKAGLRSYGLKDRKMPVNMAFDQAKIACDSIKQDTNRCWAVYTDKMGEEWAVSNYILANLDRALSDGSIKVYLQPIVRTMTEKLCSVEALTRWHDEKYGLLKPSVFIPVLEKAGMIHKLDRFVIAEAGRIFHYQHENNLPLQPISFNLSRLDFTLMDPVQEVEQMVQRYDIPHDYIHIEITETAMVRENDRLIKAMQKFRENGYQIWLDDFGSGYSSLNVLKDYSLDGIKLDMVFLRNFDEQSRKIVTAVVSMAKKLGLHTLAEGVETEEQMQFLQAIGCEEIQGYYYGRPVLYEDYYRYCGNNYFVMENRLEHQIYSQVGLLDLVTDSPLALVKEEKGQLGFIYRNAGLNRELAGMGIDEEAIASGDIFQPRDFMRTRLREFCRQVRNAHAERTFHFMRGGQYYRLKLRLLAGSDVLSIYCLNLENLTVDQKKRKQAQRFDAVLRHIYAAYHDIYYLDRHADTCEVILTANSWERAGQCHHDISAFIASFANRCIALEDQQRFLAYMNPRSLTEIWQQDKETLSANCFQVRQSDGSYRWMAFEVIPVVQSEEQGLLLNVKDFALERCQDRKAMVGRIASTYGVWTGYHISQEEENFATLWRSLLQYSGLKLFWKNRSGRYLGAAQKFAEFYGLSQPEKILGHTDAEMGWYIDDMAPWREETEILSGRRGACCTVMECTAKGIPQLVGVLRWPIYRDGRIAGIAGFIEDNDTRLDFYRQAITDPLTGLLNYRGMMISNSHFAENYFRYGEDYVAVLLEVPEFTRIAESYGDTAGNHLLQKLAMIIAEKIPVGGVLSRTNRARFIYLQKNMSDEEIRNWALTVSNAVHAVHEIDGCSCTLYVQYAVGHGSEVKTAEQLLELLSMRLIEAEKYHFGEAVFFGERIVFDREKFDDMDERVYMSDLRTYDLVYVNRSAREDLNLPADFTCQGKKCYEVIVGSDAPCRFCTNKLLRRDRFHTWTYHNPLSSKDYLIRDTLVPWHGKNYRFSMSINLTQYLVKDQGANDFVYREAAFNDAILLALQKKNPSEGIYVLLDKIGQELQADRISLFEILPGDQAAANTYEWCRDGVKPLQQQLQHVEMTALNHLYTTFQHNQLFVIPDMDEYMAEHKGFVPYMPDIHSYIAGQIKISDRTVGHVQVINPRRRIFQDMGYLIMNLTYFLASLLRIRDMMRCLEASSFEDQLTGIGNRRGLQEYWQHMPEGIPCAFIFGDINGLKRVNDEQGHEAGDALILAVSQIMCEELDQKHVFRMGGDEFFMVAEQKTEAEAQELLQKLRQRFKEKNVDVALGMITAVTPIADPDRLLSAVDRRMYEDKGILYGRRRTDRRTSAHTYDGELNNQQIRCDFQNKENHQ